MYVYIDVLKYTDKYIWEDLLYMNKIIKPLSAVLLAVVMVFGMAHSVSACERCDILGILKEVLPVHRRLTEEELLRRSSQMIRYFMENPQLLNIIEVYTGEYYFRVYAHSHTLGDDPILDMLFGEFAAEFVDVTVFIKGSLTRTEFRIPAPLYDIHSQPGCSPGQHTGPFYWTMFNEFVIVHTGGSTHGFCAVYLKTEGFCTACGVHIREQIAVQTFPCSICPIISRYVTQE